MVIQKPFECIDCLRLESKKQLHLENIRNIDTNTVRIHRLQIVWQMCKSAADINCKLIMSVLKHCSHIHLLHSSRTLFDLNIQLNVICHSFRVIWWFFLVYSCVILWVGFWQNHHSIRFSSLCNTLLYIDSHRIASYRGCFEMCACFWASKLLQPHKLFPFNANTIWANRWMFVQCLNFQYNSPVSLH